MQSVKAVPVQPRGLEVTDAVHPSIRRYAELSCAVYVLGLSYEPLLSRELWEEPMTALALEMVYLLMKLASCVKENVGAARRLHVEAALLHPQLVPLCRRGLRRAARGRGGGRRAGLLSRMTSRGCIRTGCISTWRS